MATKPNRLPEWATGAADMDPPTLINIEEGWEDPQKPGAIKAPERTKFNWWMNNVYRWIDWFEERAFDFATPSQVRGGRDDLIVTPYSLNGVIYGRGGSNPVSAGWIREVTGDASHVVLSRPSTLMGINIGRGVSPEWKITATFDVSVGSGSSLGRILLQVFPNIGSSLGGYGISNISVVNAKPGDPVGTPAQYYAHIYDPGSRSFQILKADGSAIPSGSFFRLSVDVILDSLP